MKSTSTLLKTLLATAVFSAGAATALAQGVPPKPDVKNPAIGAGHQTQNENPVGVTGTPHSEGQAQDKQSQTEGASSQPLGASADTGSSTHTLGAGSDTGASSSSSAGSTMNNESNSTLSNDNTMRSDTMRQPATTRGARADRH